MNRAITIQIIDEIVVNLEVDTITGAWTLLVNAPDQDNFVRIGQIISSDTDRLLETIIMAIRNDVLITEMIIADIVRIEVSHPEPHKYGTGITP